MSSIAKIVQILAVGAGSTSAQAIFELQTNDSTPKRILVRRKSPSDPLVYHMDHANMNAIGIFPTEVVNMYENTWPVGLTPSLGVDGQLPDALNASFTQADFGTGKSGIVQFNGYNFGLGSFITTTPAATAANGTPTATDPVKVEWYNKPLVKSIGYLALAAGFVALAVAGVISIFKKK